MAKLASRVIIAGCLLAVWAGCSESDSHSRNDAGDHNMDDACGIIAARCHPYATLPEAAMCHDLGHVETTPVEDCEAALDSCLAICPELEAGTPDAGRPDAAGDADSEACAAYCACMVPTCGVQIGGDFTDSVACEARCSTYSQTELTCWAGFCESAQAGTSVTHNCDHAAGLLDLEECP